MSATLTRSAIAARVPAIHVDKAVEVMAVADTYAALGSASPYPEGWALPLGLCDAADALVRAGMLTSPSRLRYLKAESREVVL